MIRIIHASHCKKKPFLISIHNLNIKVEMPSKFYQQAWQIFKKLNNKMSFEPRKDIRV